jgi:hypothetical protein
VTSLRSWPQFLRSFLCGWMSWLFAFAIWMIIDSDSSTAPFNRPTAYMLFSAFYTVLYLIEFIIVVPLAYALLTKLWPSSRPWQWAVLGGALFALSVPLWEAGFHHDNRDDTIFGCVLATLAGATAFYVLRRPKLSLGATV